MGCGFGLSCHTLSVHMLTPQGVYPAHLYIPSHTTLCARHPNLHNNTSTTNTRTLCTLHPLNPPTGRGAPEEGGGMEVGEGKGETTTEGGMGEGKAEEPRGAGWGQQGLEEGHKTMSGRGLCVRVCARAGSSSLFLSPLASRVCMLLLLVCTSLSCPVSFLESLETISGARRRVRPAGARGGPQDNVRQRCVGVCCVSSCVCVYVLLALSPR